MKNDFDIIDVDYEVISDQAVEIEHEIAEDEMREGLALYDTSSVITRSNALILSKFKSTLTESKLLLLAIYFEASGAPARFTTQQLIDALQIKKSSSVYNTIKTAAIALSKTQYWYEDSVNHKFLVVNLIESAKYTNGVLEIRLTEFARKNIIGLKKSFTSMNLSTLMSFGTGGARTEKTNYSLRLYELLKTRLYHCTQSRKTYSFSMLLTDIKITIGAIDPSDPGIEKANIYGKVLHLSDTELEKQAASPEAVSFRRFNQFEERVLKKSMHEINSKTDLCFEYSPVRQGSAHKVTHVISTIWRNTDMETEEDNEQKLRLIREVEQIIQEPVKTRDIERILSAAGNDTEKVRNAYHLARNSRTPIRNLTAWLIAAIREEWKIQDDSKNYPIEQGRLYDIRRGAEMERKEKAKKGKKPNAFNDFEQNSYNWDVLEEELLASGIVKDDLSGHSTS